MFREISLENMDLIIRDGMFVRKSLYEQIASLIRAAKEARERRDLILATAKISQAIRAYGDVDDVPPDLYRTRSSYWTALSDDEHNRETRKRYQIYAMQDLQRMRAQRGNL